jgi:hypothetical protein
MSSLKMVHMDQTCRSVYTNVLIVNFNIFMLIKCAFVGQKTLIFIEMHGTTTTKKEHV